MEAYKIFCQYGVTAKSLCKSLLINLCHLITLLVFQDGLIMYITSIITAVLFFIFCMHWNTIIKQLNDIDEKLSHIRSNSKRWTLKTRLRLTTIIFFLLSILEQAVSFSSFLHDRYTSATVCEWKIDNHVFFILTTHLSHVYTFFNVGILSGLWAEYMQLTMTFGWSFKELFVILISMKIASFYELVNEQLADAQKMVSLYNVNFHSIISRFQIQTKQFWEEMRSFYDLVSKVQEFIDEKVGSLVCLACLLDVFYICVTIINVFT